jgi:hypothetical protein
MEKGGRRRMMKTKRKKKEGRNWEPPGDNGALNGDTMRIKNIMIGRGEYRVVGIFF